ncbi:MAG: bifunctional glutamate N-acetyltransferase/amino-acid acetyltransferase ArgJ [Candidatus Omnitrophota bacterium]
MGVTYPKGFLSSGISAGIKTGGKKDLALVLSEEPASAAGVATTNKFKAASLILSLKHLRNKYHRAILINSGNANAVNGKEGIAITRRLVAGLAAGLKIKPEEVLFASTGKIGLVLPEDKIKKALPELVKNLSLDGQPAAEAILTTDLRIKEISLETGIPGRKGLVRIGGMAKGAGMIKPELATMLVILTTDAVIEKEALQLALHEAVKESFNLITVDDDQSTNDFVVVLANGKAGNHRIKTGTQPFLLFQDSLRDACQQLARSLAADGEGAQKLIIVRVTGAWSKKDANRIARRIAGSNLVKTTVAGNNPNWGRILAAAGSCAARIKSEKATLSLAKTLVFDRGEPISFPEEAVAKELQKPEVEIELDLGIGNFSATSYGCDLTEEYVRINKAYS